MSPDPEGAAADADADAGAGPTTSMSSMRSVEPTTMASFVEALGVDDEVLAAAVAEGPEAVRRLGFAVTLLGAPVRYTASQARERAGADEELSRQLWRAMGFAELPDEAVALTDADVDSLQLISTYLRDQGGDVETALRFTRLLGQTMGQVSDALSTLVAGRAEDISRKLGMSGAPQGVTSDDVALLASATLIPLVEQELVYLFRRHLYASAMRRIDDADLDHDDHIVGFADVVQFTRMSGQLPESDLAELLEVFEAETAAVIADHGGRVVKLIGDAVMFTTVDDLAAAHTALALVEAFGGARPELRVGMAHGPVIARQGDLFGPTVNLASRLVSFARPGTVLVDGPLAAHLEDASGIVVKSLRPRVLKGIGETALYVLRRDERA